MFPGGKGLPGGSGRTFPALVVRGLKGEREIRVDIAESSMLRIGMAGKEIFKGVEHSFRPVPLAVEGQN